MMSFSLPFTLETLAMPAMQPYVLGFTAVVGLLLGSFLNVVGLRLLSGESFIAKPSHCPKCLTRLRWFENIPLLSYVLQAGKCRHCQAPIHWQYPAAELAMSLLCVAIVAQFGLSWLSLGLVYFAAQCLVMVITDLKASLIFHLNSLGLVPVGLLLHALVKESGWLTQIGWTAPWVQQGAQTGLLSDHFASAAMGVLGIWALFEGLIAVSRLVMGEDGFGHGDTYLLMGVAAFLGWEWALVTLVLGGALQAIVSVPVLLRHWLQQGWDDLVLLFATALLLATAPFGLAQLMGLDALASLAVQGVATVGVLWLLKHLLSQVRRKGSFSSAPFGPALIVAALLCVFVGVSHVAPLVRLVVPQF